MPVLSETRNQMCSPHGRLEENLFRQVNQPVTSHMAISSHERSPSQIEQLQARLARYEPPERVLALSNEGSFPTDYIGSCNY